MARIIDNPDRAWRKARAIVSDIAIYNEDKVKEGIENDTFFDVMSEALREGRELFKGSVTEELYALNIFDRTIVDRLIKSKAH